MLAHWQTVDLELCSTVADECAERVEDSTTVRTNPLIVTLQSGGVDVLAVTQTICRSLDVLDSTLRLGRLKQETTVPLLLQGGYPLLYYGLCCT